MSLGFTIVGDIFVYVTIFNPTIEVVTFLVHTWSFKQDWSYNIQD